MPVSWLVALLTATAFLNLVASFRGMSVAELLKSEESFWPLVLMVPAVLFGKVLGLMGVNLLAYATPLRRVFERESVDTGRQGFSAAMAGLGRVAFALLLVLVIATAFYLYFAL